MKTTENTIAEELEFVDIKTSVIDFVERKNHPVTTEEIINFYYNISGRQDDPAIDDYIRKCLQPNGEFCTGEGENLKEVYPGQFIIY